MEERGELSSHPDSCRHAGRLRQRYHHFSSQCGSAAAPESHREGPRCRLKHLNRALKAEGTRKSEAIDLADAVIGFYAVGGGKSPGLHL